MSDHRDPDTDQPLPVANDRPYVQDLVLADIKARKQLGIRKYGTALQPGNGRNMLLDAYEEALDLCIYLRGELEERGVAGAPPEPRYLIVPPLPSWIHATERVTSPPSVNEDDWLRHWGRYSGYAGVIAAAMQATRDRA